MNKKQEKEFKKYCVGVDKGGDYSCYIFPVGELDKYISKIRQKERENMIKVIEDKLTTIPSNKSKNPDYCRGVTDGWDMMGGRIIKALKDER